MIKLIDNFTENSLLIKDTGIHFVPPFKWKKLIEADYEKLQRKAKDLRTKIWNGKVYRLLRIKKWKNKSILYLGTIDYKMHHATPLLRETLKKIPFDKRPNGMYVSSYIQTSDGKLIFGLKSEKATSKYSINFLGGILNQNEMEINTAGDLFRYFYKEFKEETGIAKRFTKDTEGLGIFIADDLKIMVLLKITLSIPSYQFKKIAKTSIEHKKFVLLDKNRLKKLVFKESGVNPNIQKTLPFLK